jgi:hypothetical protein
MQPLRELSRRRLRTTLTIVGMAPLRRFNRERGQTVLLVTRDAEVGSMANIRTPGGCTVAGDRVTEVRAAAA